MPAAPYSRTCMYGVHRAEAAAESEPVGQKKEPNWRTTLRADDLVQEGLGDGALPSPTDELSAAEEQKQVV